MTGNFDSDLHALFTGLLTGPLHVGLGADVRPVVDDDGNFLPQIRVEWRGAEFVLDVRQVG